MTRIYGPTAFDTPEIAALRERINDADRRHDEERRKHRQIERAHVERYETLLRARRPDYPTMEQLRGLEQVARLVHEDIPYGDHLGYPLPRDEAAGLRLPPAVHFSSQTPRVNVYALAPYAANSTRRLWELTPEEIAALRAHLRRLSLGVVTQWIHEDGVAFIVRNLQV